jgi:hypothetical protein
MGSSTSKANLRVFENTESDINRGKVKYVKNFNKYGDSDYDDEVDSIAAELESKANVNISREQHFDDDEYEQEKLLNGEGVNNMQNVSEEDIPEDKGEDEKPKRDPRALRSNMDPQQ